MKPKRVVITGLGVFSAAGSDVASFTASLRTGRSAIGAIDLFDVSDLPSGIGAQVRGYDPHAYFT